MEKLSEYTDEQLALSYSKGNNRAFDELLIRTGDKLFSYILFIIHDEEKANDLFQETFVKAISHLQEGRYTVSGRFSAWIMRIAHNVIMDWYRNIKAKNVIDGPNGNDLTNLRGNDILDTNVENKYVNEQVKTDVRRIMDKLPPLQKEVVYMRYYRDMSFKDIALTTGVSINTALGRMHYALLNMRRMSQKHGIALQFD